MVETTTDRVDRLQFTVEMGLYGLSLVLALALRVSYLERWPLLDHEAALALAAWRFARGLPTSLRGHSPLLFHLNTLLFFFASGSDALARLWCVLCGSLMTLLPYGLRGRLGRIGSLAASILLAISPSFVYFSRSVDGSIVVAFCALGLLVLLNDYLMGRRQHRLVLAATLVALSMLASPSAYTWISLMLAFVFVVLIWHRWRNVGPVNELRQVWQGILEDTATVRQAVAVVGVLVLALGLAFTYNVAGAQMALDQFGQWVGGFQFLEGSPWYFMPLVLVIYEALPLFFGLAGFALLRLEQDLWTWLLRFWFVFALLFSIVPGYRPAHGVLLLALPLILAAGYALERLAQSLQPQTQRGWLWALVAMSLLMSAAVYIHLANHLSVPATGHLVRVAALSVFIFSGYALVWSFIGGQVPARAAAVSLLLLLLFGVVRAQSRVNWDRARDAMEPLVGTAVSPEVLELAQETALLSRNLQGDPRVMTIELEEELEIPLGWYLRHMEQVASVRGPVLSSEAGAVIAGEDRPGPAGYVGQRFALRSGGATLSRSPMEWLQWWADIRPPTIGYPTERVILWVRTTS